MEEESQAKIAGLAMQLFTDNITVLVHGHSKTVLETIVQASRNVQINVIVTECRPLCEGYQMI